MGPKNEPNLTTIDDCKTIENGLKIYCRLRPLFDENVAFSANEAKSVTTLVERKSDTILALRRPNSCLEQQFEFGHVFASECPQADVFVNTTVPLIKALFEGRDALMFAYGATGSGKSYTINGTPIEPGIIPRIIDWLFVILKGNDENNRSCRNEEYDIQPDFFNHYTIKRRNLANDKNCLASLLPFEPNLMILSANERQKHFKTITEWSKRMIDAKVATTSIDSERATKAIATRRYSVFISFTEIYNNYVYDLFEVADNSKRTPHELRHDVRHRVYACGATQVEAVDADHAIRLFLFGLRQRQTAATLLNQNSSRSHSIFTIKLVSYRLTSADKMNSNQEFPSLQVNQLSVVDLAGIERAKRTKAQGAKLAEASNINKSLLTLRNCFEALRAKQSNLSIPYRQHKLTFLLKSFFVEGNSLIRMIVCVKPSSDDLDDNVQVLSFGKKAHQVVIETIDEQSSNEEDDNNDYKLSDQQKQSELTMGQFTNQGNSFGSIFHDGSSSKRRRLTEFKFEFTLTRFKANNSVINRHELVYEVEKYLNTYKLNFCKTSSAIDKILQHLNKSLGPEILAKRGGKNFDELSSVLQSYGFNLFGSFALKLGRLRRVKNEPSGFAGSMMKIQTTVEANKTTTPLCRTSFRLINKSQIIFDEMLQNLSRWNSASLAARTYFSSRMDLITLDDEYDHLGSMSMDSAVKDSVSSSSNGVRKMKMDVFTRLYRQTPARYRATPTTNVHDDDDVRVRQKSVAELKRFFTPNTTTATTSISRLEMTNSARQKRPFTTLQQKPMRFK